MLRNFKPMKLQYYFLFFLIFSLASCGRLPAKVVPKEDIKDVSFKAQMTDSGYTLKGDLVIEPFKSGENVPASLDVDQASLMMVKGFVEAMPQGNSPLKVITDSDTSRAKIFIKGYITKYEKSEGLMDYVQKKPNVLTVEGKVINLEDNRVIVDFSASIQSIEQSNFNDFAYKIGQRLAAYLVGQEKGSL